MKGKKKNRLFIKVGDVRIAPDIISGYSPISNPGYETGLLIILAEGKSIEIDTTEKEQQQAIAKLDELTKPIAVK